MLTRLMYSLLLAMVMIIQAKRGLSAITKQLRRWRQCHRLWEL